MKFFSLRENICQLITNREKQTAVESAHSRNVY